MKEAEHCISSAKRAGHERLCPCRCVVDVMHGAARVGKRALGSPWAGRRVGPWASYANRLRGRWARDIGDARIELHEDGTDALDSFETSGMAAGLPQAKSRWQAGLWILAALLVGGVLAWGLKPLPQPLPQSVAHLAIPFERGETLVSPDAFASAVLSPDGTRLIYLASQEAGRQFYLRSLDQLSSRPIPGTKGAFDPFFSPDG